MRRADAVLTAQAELSLHDAAAADQAAFLRGAVVASAQPAFPAAGLTSWGDPAGKVTARSRSPRRGASRPSSRGRRGAYPARQSALEQSAAWAEELVQQERVRDRSGAASRAPRLVSSLRCYPRL